MNDVFILIPGGYLPVPPFSEDRYFTLDAFLLWFEELLRKEGESSLDFFFYTYRVGSQDSAGFTCKVLEGSLATFTHYVSGISSATPLPPDKRFKLDKVRNFILNVAGIFP